VALERRQGVFKSSDGKISREGGTIKQDAWRGREKFMNGDCFLVYYKNGYRIDALASKKKHKDASPAD